MKYFKHQYSGSLGEVWSLFSGLSNIQDVDPSSRRCDYSHTIDIIKSAMNGNIHSDDFNLQAYEIKCSQVDEKTKGKQRDKYLSIVDAVNGKDENVVGYGEISINDGRLKSIEDAFELLEDNDEFEKCLAEFFNIRKDYIVEKGIDIVEMLSSSLEGIPEAVHKISELVLEDSSLRRIVEVLCASSSNNLRVKLAEAY